jgi:HK97 family phage portal protein
MKLKRKAATKPKPRKKAAQSLSPVTQPADPEYSRSGLMLPMRSSGVVVTEDSAMSQTTVWACIKVISEGLAGLPWRVGTIKRDSTIDILESHPLDWILNFAANDETQAFAFRETLWAWALGWGNGYAEIERDMAGNPVALWQLHPSRVRPMRLTSGGLIYEVLNDDEPPDYLRPRDMFHLKGPSPDGLVGWSVIRMHARTIGLAIAQEENASSFNANDSTPGGILEHPGKLSETAAANLEKTWNRRHQGPKNRRTVAILEEGMKWNQTGLPPDEAKLVEQMQLTPSMICRIFGVPPHMVADLTRSTNNNIEEQGIEFVRSALRPWAERGESEADVKLFGRNNQARLVTVIDLSERERGDTASQTNHVERMIFTGVYSLNEGRRYLGLQGIGPEGDQRFIQSAMIPIDQAGKQNPTPDANPPEDSTDEPAVESPTMDEPSERMSRLQVGCMGVLTDACRRMLKRENDEGARKLTGDAFSQWQFKHREYCREILLPAARLLSECFSANGEATEVAVSLFLDKHFKEPPGTPESKAAELRSYLLAAAAAKGAA